MNQQINLFLQLPRPKVETGKYTVKNLLIVSGLVLMAGISYAVYINIKAQGLSNEVKQLTADKEAAKQHYDATSAQYPAEAKAALVNQAKDIEQQITVKKALLNLLQNSSLGTQGFAERMQALSENIQAGMWITHIQFNLTQQYIGLAGISTQVEPVLTFVDKLSKSPAFANEKFAVFKLEKPEGATGNTAMSFVLSNNTGMEPSKPEVPMPEPPKPEPEPAASIVSSGAALNTDTSTAAQAEATSPKGSVTMLPETHEDDESTETEVDDE